MYANASAALVMVARQGVGKIRHLDTRILWVQESSLRRGLTYEMVKGSDNPVDPLTKYVGTDRLENMLQWSGMEWRDSMPTAAEATRHHSFEA